MSASANAVRGRGSTSCSFILSAFTFHFDLFLVCCELQERALTDLLCPRLRFQRPRCCSCVCARVRLILSRAFFPLLNRQLLFGATHRTEQWRLKEAGSTEISVSILPARCVHRGELDRQI
jgi:hypothetical protein